MSLLMLKSVLTTLVLLLAVGEAFSGMRLRGYFQRVGLPLRPLRLWHRIGGDVTLALTAVVAIICVTHLGVGVYPLRVPAHAALGALAGLAMVVKVVIARRHRRLLRHALKIGAVAGFCVLGTFAFSALWYFLLIL